LELEVASVHVHIENKIFKPCSRLSTTRGQCLNPDQFLRRAFCTVWSMHNSGNWLVIIIELL